MLACVLVALLGVCSAIDSDRVLFGGEQAHPEQPDVDCGPIIAWVNFKKNAQLMSFNVELPSPNPEGYDSIGCTFPQTQDRFTAKYSMVASATAGVFDDAADYYIDACADGGATIEDAETTFAEDSPKLSTRGAQLQRDYVAQPEDARKYDFKDNDLLLEYRCCISNSASKMAGLDQCEIDEDTTFCCAGVERLGVRDIREPHVDSRNAGEDRGDTQP